MGSAAEGVVPNGVTQLRREIRREQSVQAVGALAKGIADWVERRREADRNTEGAYIGRHKTQLDSIESVLGGAANALCDEAAAITSAAEAAEVYRRCRQVDEAAAWLQRLWEFYRDKFDQRDAKGELGATVKAADEIVWSAYHQVMSATAVRKKGISHGPAPLPFVAPEYSPGAVGMLARSLSLPVEFPTWDEELKKLVARLAVPLLVLPSWCVGAPWWLVFVLHEVGHHLTRQLGVFAPFAEAIDHKVSQATGDAALGGSWRRWTEEVLADAWSVVLTGRPAVEALAEVELGNGAGLAAASTQYPAPLARLAVMRRLAERLKVAKPSLPPEIDLGAPAFDSTGAPQRTAVDAVAAALELAVPGLGSLATLAALVPQEQANATAFWTKALRSGAGGPADTLESARVVTAGAFGAWQRLGEETGSLNGHTTGARALADRALSVLTTAGPPGTRAAEQPDGSAPGVGSSLVQRLLALSQHGSPDVAAAAGS